MPQLGGLLGGTLEVLCRRSCLHSQETLTKAPSHPDNVLLTSCCEGQSIPRTSCGTSDLPDTARDQAVLGRPDPGAGVTEDQGTWSKVFNPSGSWKPENGAQRALTRPWRREDRRSSLRAACSPFFSPNKSSFVPLNFFPRCVFTGLPEGRAQDKAGLVLEMSTGKW